MIRRRIRSTARAGKCLVTWPSKPHNFSPQSSDSYNIIMVEMSQEIIFLIFTCIGPSFELTHEEISREKIRQIQHCTFGRNTTGCPKEIHLSCIWTSSHQKLQRGLAGNEAISTDCFYGEKPDTLGEEEYRKMEVST